MAQLREQWTSRVGFILAAAGSAVGLGNIWKFPYLVGENGGAVFIFLYLICVIIIGLPVVIAETLIGRTAQKNPVGSFKLLSKGNPFWMGVGILGVITGFIILSYYNVIAGWCLGYVVESLKGSFQAMNNTNQAAQLFNRLSGSGRWSLTYHAIFMALTVSIIYFGVTNGIEKSSKILMPSLIIIILILIVRGITLENSRAGIVYLLKPDFTYVTGRTVLMALGQAFFSLSIGMGVMITYGSYLSKKDNIPSSATNIVVIDTVVALLAGFMIFPAIFALGMKPDQGPALLFNTLPILFNQIPGGYWFRILFFILMGVAALTSTISLLEVVTAYFVDEYNLSRKRIAIIAGTVIFLLGVPSALSFGRWSAIRIMNLSFFNFFDYLAANILLPVGGLFITIFVGWFWSRENVISEINKGAGNVSAWILKSWYFLIRYIAPGLVAIVLLNSIGIL
ncbi:MAG: sodium-dependent transporter [Candidatus Neomarinimicrobiota bacterium]